MEMNPLVTIAVCFKAGTKDILKIFLSSIFLYTRKHFKIVVITADDQSTREAMEAISPSIYVECVEVKIGDVQKARIHGAMLDSYLASNQVTTEYLLTMDSDCFPVADGWLEGLLKMMDDGARVSGILHPLAPPPTDMDHCKIEWRVRSQHCWDGTHVACQMIRVVDLKELGVTYAGGDDTGLLIQLEAKKRGWKVDGYKVTRCAKPRDKSAPEFNRYVCLIFGDKVYHHGGFTRIATMGDKPVMEAAYEWVLQSLMLWGDAGFLLNENNSYKFKFDREEEVAQEKMSRLFNHGLVKK